MKLNKKSQFIFFSVTDIWAILAFVIMLFVFYLLFTFSKSDSAVQINTYAELANADMMLLNYLRAATEINGEAVSHAALINMILDEKDNAKKNGYVDILRSKTKLFFDPMEYCYTTKAGGAKIGYGIYVSDDIDTTYDNIAKVAARTNPLPFAALLGGYYYDIIDYFAYGDLSYKSSNFNPSISALAAYQLIPITNGVKYVRLYKSGYMNLC